jgi:hypothetical protein
MKKIIIIALLLSTPAILHAGDWTKTDTARQTAYLICHAADWLQTKEISRNPDHYETNIILGKHPGQNEIDAYFLGTAIAHTAISYYLPPKYRRIWQYVTLSFEMGVVGHNIGAGVAFNF